VGGGAGTRGVTGLKRLSLLVCAALGIAGGLTTAASPADPDLTAADTSPSCADSTAAATTAGSLVAEGACWWMRSPDPGNPVACATCHDDRAAIRHWAASFPKFKPEPPPDARVMTLLQANSAAVARHYRLADPRPAATAITAYLTWLGAGLPVSPGISAGQPVFAERLRQLALSTARGRRIYAQRCGACHELAGLAAAVGAYPRREQGRPPSIEAFLESHHPRGRPLRWDGPAMADLLAYLVSQMAGRPLAAARSPAPSVGETP